MSTLTLADYQSRVLLALGNIATTHPIIAAGMHTSAINAAANALIRRYPLHFHETRNYAWQIGPTVVEQNYIALPSATDAIPKLLELHRVVSNELETTPSSAPSSWAEVDEQLVPFVNVSTIGMGPKDSTTDVGYPAQCERQGSDLIYRPTTRTGYTCYLRVYGTRGEYTLNSAGDTFLMDADYDDALIFEAAGTIATAMGWEGKATSLRGYVKTQMDMLAPAAVGELVSRPSRFTISGMPQ